jgi:twinkle protein
VDSELVEKGLPCEACGSSDALALYDDGHTYCFSCKNIEGGSTVSKSLTKPSKDSATLQAEITELLSGSITMALPGWDLTQATCRFADYRVKAVSPDKGYHLAVYKDEAGIPCFVKVRVVSPTDTKVDFFGIGDQSKVTLWGSETLGSGGPMVVVTEGEKDRLAGLQLWNCRFPVVSIPFGAESSEKAFARALDKLSRYDKVVLALDMDTQGREGAIALAKMLPPGKAYIAEFPSKDLHQTVKEFGQPVAKSALYNATPYQPGGVLDADDVDASLDEAPQWGDGLPPEMAELYEWTYGLLPGQVWVGGAGTSAGKSDWSAQIIAHHIRPVEDGGNGKRAALFNYESDSADTLRTVLSKLKGKNFSIPDPEDGSENIYWTRDQLSDARSYRREKCGKLFINDHKGLISWDSTEERIRYLYHAYGVNLFVVDPVAALVSNFADKTTELDRLFARAKSLAEELGITILFWSHLTRPSEGANHEEGGQVRTSQFRGSNSISMWADVVFGIERNQQAEDETDRTTATLRTLKIRKAGRNTGRTFQVIYNVLSGVLERRVTEMDKMADQDAEEPEAPPL